MAIKKINISVKVDNKQANTSMKATEKALDGIEKEAKEAGQATSGMWKEMLKGQTAFAILQKGFRMVTGIVKDAVDIFAQQELAEKRLASALELTGESANITFKELDQVARSIQNLTTVGDEVTMEVMQLGLTMGIAGDQLQGATEQAIGLSKAFGVDLNSAMKMVALARQGEFTMLQRYIPQLRSTTDATEKLAITNDILAKGFELAKAETDTFTGSLLQIKNSFGDLQEELGRGITQSDAMRGALESIKELLEDPDFVKSVRDIGEGIGFLIAKLIELGVIIVQNAKHLQTLATGFATVGGAIRDALDETEKIEQTNKSTGELIDKFDQLTTVLGLTDKEIFVLMQKYKDITDATELFNKVNRDLQKQIDDTGKTVKEYGGIWETAQDKIDLDMWEGLTKSMDDMDKATKKFNDGAGEDQVLLQQVLQGEIERTTDEVVESLPNFDKYAQALWDISRIASGLTEILGDDLVNAIGGASDAFQSFIAGDIVGGFAGLMGTFAGGDLFNFQKIWDEEMARQEQARQEEIKRQEDFIKEQKKQAQSGIDAFGDFIKAGYGKTMDALGKVREDISKETDKAKKDLLLTKEDFLTDRLAEDIKDEMDSIINITLSSFAKLAQEGVGITDIFLQLGDNFDLIREGLKALGEEGNETINKLLDFQEFTKNNKDLLDSISALNNALIGMSKGGMIQTQDAFDDFQKLAGSSFDKLKDAGATSDQAMLTMLPNLRELNRLSEEQGFILDDNIKAMIDQAKKKGIFEGELDPLKEIVDLLGLLVEHFTGIGTGLADAVGGTADGLRGLAGGAGRAGGAEIIPLPRAGGGGLSGSPGGANVTEVRKTVDQKIAFKINVDVAGASEEAGAILGRAVVEGIIKANRLNKLGLQTELTGTG